MGTFSTLPCFRNIQLPATTAGKKVEPAATQAHSPHDLNVTIVNQPPLSLPLSCSVCMCLSNKSAGQIICLASQEGPE